MYESFDRAERIVDIFLTHPDCSKNMKKDKESLKLAVQSILDYRPKWIRDCDCEERDIYCDCQQLSER